MPVKLRFIALSLACAPLLIAPLAAQAEVPVWMTGAWSTNARLTAPDGAQLRIRCTMDAAADGIADGARDWTGTLGCATVQGRFEGRWEVALDGAATAGRVLFSGIERSELALTGSTTPDRVQLTSPDGQGVTFTPGAEGALVVMMQALGPQRLTGSLTFEER